MAKEVKTIFGERLREALSDRKVSQAELAKVLGYKHSTANTISYYCSGQRWPNLKQFVAIADYLGVSADYLLGRGRIPDTTESSQIASAYTGLTRQAVTALHGMSPMMHEVVSDMVTAVRLKPEGSEND